MTGPRDTLAGRVLDGRYRLDARVGGGGMGEVYRGRHLMMDHKVAIKVLRPDLAADPTAARRFGREAKATFRLDHQNCVRVTDFGTTEDGLIYLVMEYLDGRTVGDELRIDGAMSSHRVVHVARQVCAALDCAHGIGLIHRDLKPDNLMLVQRGNDVDTVKVLDFGLAKIMTGPDGALTAAFSMSPLTRQGMVFGTPEYMSPEQAMDEPLSPLTDIYSLGVVMYEMLTGGLPFTGETFMAVLAMHVREQPEPLASRRPDLAIPAALDSLVLQCLAKEPADRPPSASALAHALAELEAWHQPVSRVAQHVAASSTVDLDRDAVGQAADETTMSLRQVPMAPAAPLLPLPAPPLSASEPRHIVLAHQARKERSSAEARVSGAVDSPDAQVRTTTGQGNGQATSAQAVPATRLGARPRARWSRWLMLGMLSVVLIGTGVGATVKLIRSSSNTSDSDLKPLKIHTHSPSSELPAETRVPAPGIMVENAASEAEDASIPVLDRGSAPLDAAPMAPDITGIQAAPPPRRSDLTVSKRVKAHLQAAERASRAGNILRQMAEADSALRLDPRSREAAYWLGDALLHSDRTRGCKYLRKARQLRKAREAYRQAGCPP